MGAPPDEPRVFNIPPGVPFLPTLADALLARRLAPFGDDPLDLAGVTILLPTRRAVRAFRDALIERLGGDAAIFPIIRPIGDIDEEDQLFDSAAETVEERLVLPRAIAPLSRRLILTQLTLAWGRALRRHALGAAAGEPLLVPGSAADATRLAADLARLIDDMQIAGLEWSELARIAPDDHADYYKLTLEFLRIVTENWPEHLAAHNLVDPALRRNQLADIAVRRLEVHGSRGPIIAAGSTGSIPATANLLRQIAKLPNGAVVLPGIDTGLDEAGWAAIGADDDQAAGQAHPQYGLKKLIEHIGIVRSDVIPLVAESPQNQGRTRIVSEAVRPAQTLEAWASFNPATGALDGVSLLLARNEQEEALAIALAIRKALENNKTSALVTPDRTLARRVAAELGRWNLAVDDSAGQPLDNEAHGVFARLVVDAAATGNPVQLLALSKHPLAAFGMDRATCRDAARALELALFRGHRVSGGIANLPKELAAAKAIVTAGDARVHPARKALTARRRALAERLADRIAEGVGPVEDALRKDEDTAAAHLTGILATALVAAATDDTGSDAALTDGAGGAALEKLLANLIDDPASQALMIAPGDYPYFLSALMREVAVTRPPGGETRIHIWGALEARLQSVDVMILGGLDEGVWPTATRTDPWLSRAMRAEIGLPPPERRLGLAAHDFTQGMAGAEVIVTRAEKRGGAPTVESRWLQRIRALAGKDAMAEITERGAEYVRLARELDRPAGKLTVTDRPEPRPPISARPRQLSITEIETLIRDPYAIYARHILKLRPLDPLGLEPDRALRGTLIHDALGKFTQQWAGMVDADAIARLRAIGAETLSAVKDFPDVLAVWSLRFAAIADWFADWERQREAKVERRHAEISGAWAIKTPAGIFTLTGRADRIDEMADGTIAIYDFKTGTPQTERTIYAGLTPQMTLEAAMVRAGAFPDVTTAGGKDVSDLAWLAIGRIGRQDPYQSAVKRDQTPNDAADSAARFFIELVTAYDDPAKGYLSRARPMMERYPGDYDHLARVREWALVDSAEDRAAAGIPK